MTPSGSTDKVKYLQTKLPCGANVRVFPTPYGGLHMQVVGGDEGAFATTDKAARAGHPSNIFYDGTLEPQLAVYMSEDAIDGLIKLLQESKKLFGLSGAPAGRIRKVR